MSFEPGKRRERGNNSAKSTNQSRGVLTCRDQPGSSGVAALPGSVTTGDATTWLMTGSTFGRRRCRVLAISGGLHGATGKSAPVGYMLK